MYAFFDSLGVGQNVQEDAQQITLNLRSQWFEKMTNNGQNNSKVDKTTQNRYRNDQKVTKLTRCARKTKVERKNLAYFQGMYPVFDWLVS